ncbi:MAG: serine/threonine-protein kinase [Planctomycetota bacterium]
MSHRGPDDDTKPKGRPDEQDTLEEPSGAAFQSSSDFDVTASSDSSFLDSRSGMSGSWPSHAVSQDGAGLPKIDGYRVIEPLGQGGMGTVWRAEQLSTSREVALKLLGGAMFMSDRARPRFEREVKLAARLDHSNIATIYDSGIHRGVCYYAMQLIDGLTLDQFIQQRKLPRKLILKLIQIVCGAVQHAHELGIVHRDLKPGNIMVTASGKPVVLDFGLAKAVDDEEGDATLTNVGDVAGTPAYMAPEQAEGVIDQIGPHTDVYALGAILYRLLTGEPPTNLTGSKLQVLNRIAQGEIREPSIIVPSIDAELQALLLKALAVDPAKRFNSAAEMGEVIKLYLDHLKSGQVLAPSDASGAYVSEGPSVVSGELSALQTRVSPADQHAVNGLDDLIQAAATFEPSSNGSGGRSSGVGPRWLIIAGVAAFLVVTGTLLIVLLSGPGDGGRDDRQSAGLAIDLDGNQPGSQPTIPAPPAEPGLSNPLPDPPVTPPQPLPEPAPVPSPQPSPGLNPPPEPEQEPDPPTEPEAVLTSRAVAEWVINSGGRLSTDAAQLYPNLKLRWINRVGEIPQDLQKINVVSIRLDQEENIEQLVDLRLLPGLEALILEGQGEHLEEADWSAIEELDQVRYLRIESEDIPGDVLEHVAVLSDLRALKIYGIEFDGEDLDYLEDLEQLTNLSIRMTEVTDQAMNRIAKLSSLEALDFYDIEGFTTRGVRYLSNMRSLKLLGIRDSPLDDRGMRYLESLRDLEGLSVAGTEVTVEAMIRFKRAVPDCILRNAPGREFRLPERDPNLRPDRDRDQDRRTPSDRKPPKDERPGSR